MTPQMFIFDMDGTLYSSEPFLHESYQETIDEYNREFRTNLPIPTREKIMSQVGFTIREILSHLIPDLAENHFQLMSDRIMENILEKIRSRKGNLYPFCKKVLDEIKEKEILMTMASNARSPYLKAILQTYQLESYFQPIVTLDSPGIDSKTDMVNYYLQVHRTAKDRSLFVGDRDKDHHAAREAGVPFVWCAYGHAFPGEIKGNPTTIYSLKEILTLID